MVLLYFINGETKQRIGQNGIFKFNLQSIYLSLYRMSWMNLTVVFRVVHLIDKLLRAIIGN